MHPLHSLSDLLWLVAGDFNEILSLDEKTGRSRNIWQMDNFCSAIPDSGLFDLRFDGSKFTWKGSTLLNDHIRARLDRGLASASFSQLFPDCVVKSTLENHFDHLALCVYLSYASMSSYSGRRQT